MYRSSFSLLVASFLVAPSGAAEPRDLLRSMAGEWRVAYEMEPGPSGKGGEGEGEMTSWLGPGEASLILDYKSKTGPTAGFGIHQMIAWNSRDRSFDIVWIDSFNPGVMRAEGKLEGGNIVYARESILGDHKIVSKGVISEIGSASFTITSYMSLDGGPRAKTLTLRYTREP